MEEDWVSLKYTGFVYFVLYRGGISALCEGKHADVNNVNK